MERIARAVFAVIALALIAADPPTPEGRLPQTIHEIRPQSRTWDGTWPFTTATRVGISLASWRGLVGRSQASG